MPSYQIPQFLDSGDKILGPLNVRQFGYAMAGFIITIAIFYGLQGSFPGIGLFAFIPALPFVALFGYIALGHYNGRDSEIYVLKLFIFLAKPRLMVYQRKPDTRDIDDKMVELTYGKIIGQWEKRVLEKKQNQDAFFDFDRQDVKSKTNKIRQLGTALDQSLSNTLSQVARKEIENRGRQQLLQSLQRGNGVQHDVKLNSIVAQERLQVPQDQNYFNVQN